MKERDLKLQNYNISDNRYRELKYFCKQYREKQSQLRSITELSSPKFSSTGGGGISDRTADTACRRAQLERDIEIIEQAAIEADADIYPYIIFNVVDGVPYQYLDVPAGKNQFYGARRKFFTYLSLKRE